MRCNRFKVKHLTFSDFLFNTIIIIAIIFILFHLIFQPIFIRGLSMFPTLSDGELVLTTRHRKINRFDIVTIHLNDRKLIIKRVIGMPGDQISVSKGILYINQVKYTENYLNQQNIVLFKEEDWSTIVPKDSIFVLGDNRDISNDSRRIGSLSISSVSGVMIASIRNPFVSYTVK